MYLEYRVLYENISPITYHQDKQSAGWCWSWLLSMFTFIFPGPGLVLVLVEREDVFCLSDWSCLASLNGVLGLFAGRLMIFSPRDVTG